MPSAHFAKLRRAVALFALSLALAPTTAGAEKNFEGTIVSACEGTIGCPNKVNLRNPFDTLQFQALLNVPTPLRPGDDKFKIVLRNLNGKQLSEKLDPGQIVREGNAFVYRNDAARDTGGISRVTLRRKKAHEWRITVIAHGIMPGATLANMTIYLVIGNDTFVTKNVWSAREFGWLLHLPATAPTPGPTGSPVVTATPAPTPTAAPTPAPTGTVIATPTPTLTPRPTSTPAPTQSPAPTPTSDPYGSVFEAFVAAPSSLLN
ncbi:MAG: hypothetical protein FJ148_25205 [Deltaproteobacteria bacterium]|nr:hypothetical protein [Deltaproteobacteria bacterium]